MLIEVDLRPRADLPGAEVCRLQSQLLHLSLGCFPRLHLREHRCRCRDANCHAHRSACLLGQINSYHIDMLLAAFV